MCPTVGFKRGQILLTSCLRVWLPENSEDSTDKFKVSGKNYFGVELTESAYIFNIDNVKQCVREKPAQFFKLYWPLYCISNPTESAASVKTVKPRKGLIFCWNSPATGAVSKPSHKVDFLKALMVTSSQRFHSVLTRSYIDLD